MKVVIINGNTSTVYHNVISYESYNNILKLTIEKDGEKIKETKNIKDCLVCWEEM